MYGLGSRRSVIREIFEYGNRRRAEIGADKVFDFSLGNPSVPAPREVEQAILDLVQNSDPVALHGYTSAQGDAGVRRAVAEDLTINLGPTDKINIKINYFCNSLSFRLTVPLCLVD